MVELLQAPEIGVNSKPAALPMMTLVSTGRQSIDLEAKESWTVYTRVLIAFSGVLIAQEPIHNSMSVII